MLDNVDRIEPPAPDSFLREYVFRGRPVVITGLFDGSPVRRLEDPAVLRTELGAMPVEVREGDVERLLRGEGEAPGRRWPFGRLLDHLDADPSAVERAAELPCPPELAGLLEPPAYCGSGEVVSHLFAAGPGSCAHLHYDGDLCDVLMLQVTGRKRYVVVDPAHTRKLRPEDRPGVQRTSGWFLQHLTEPELDAFLAWAGGWHCVLDPGETLYIPAAAWHWVQYPDTAVSVNFRFWSCRALRLLAEVVPVRTVEWQALAAHFRRQDALGDDDEKVLAELVGACRAGASPAAVQALLVDLCARLGLDVAGPPLDTADWDRRRATPPPDLPPPPPAPRFRPDTRVALADGCSLVVPLRGGGVVLARHGRLAAQVGPDPTYPWTLGVLGRIDRVPGLPATELAAGALVDVDTLTAFLDAMGEAGWVQALDAQEPVRS
ncbi:MAG TPA: cupin-like domain-containing protein [Acidimicrobiales bacterium]|nr:cupin-like domain-containing protein [Acidimicrobiales bacterium]